MADITSPTWYVALVSALTGATKGTRGTTTGTRTGDATAPTTSAGQSTLEALTSAATRREEPFGTTPQPIGPRLPRGPLSPPPTPPTGANPLDSPSITTLGPLLGLAPRSRFGRTNPPSDTTSTNAKRKAFRMWCSLHGWPSPECDGFWPGFPEPEVTAGARGTGIRRALIEVLKRFRVPAGTIFGGLPLPVPRRIKLPPRRSTPPTRRPFRPPRRKIAEPTRIPTRRIPDPFRYPQFPNLPDRRIPDRVLQPLPKPKLPRELPELPSAPSSPRLPPPPRPPIVVQPTVPPMELPHVPTPRPAPTRRASPSPVRSPSPRRAPGPFAQTSFPLLAAGLAARLAGSPAQAQAFAPGSPGGTPPGLTPSQQPGLGSLASLGQPSAQAQTDACRKCERRRKRRKDACTEFKVVTIPEHQRRVCVSNIRGREFR